MRTLQIEYVRPEELTGADWNPRTITRKAMARLAALLDAHGFAQPIVARREDGLVLGGHQRLAANSIRARPDKLVPVIFLEGLDENQSRALNIALNNDQAQGRFETERLAELLDQIDLPSDELAGMTALSESQLAVLARQNDVPSPLGETLDESIDIPDPTGPEVTILLETSEQTYGQLRGQLDAWIAEGLIECHVRIDSQAKPPCK